MSTQAQVLRDKIKEEFKKCATSAEYFLSKYSYIQHPIRGRVLFDLYKYHLNKCNCKEVCPVKDKDECEKEEEISKKDILLLEAENRKVSELMFSSDSKIDYGLENIVDNDFIMDY